MKKLQLKIQDLTNPSILTHREIRNIMGGDVCGSVGQTSWTVSCVAADGYHQVTPGDVTNATKKECKTTVDAWCEKPENHCVSCSCS